jgi:hypothetical protein
MLLTPKRSNQPSRVFPRRWSVLLGYLPRHLLMFPMSYLPRTFHANTSTSALYDSLGRHQNFFLKVPTKQRQRQTVDVDALINYRQIARTPTIGFRSNLYPPTHDPG